MFTSTKFKLQTQTGIIWNLFVLRSDTEGVPTLNVYRYISDVPVCSPIVLEALKCHLYLRSTQKTVFKCSIAAVRCKQQREICRRVVLNL